VTSNIERRGQSPPAASGGTSGNACLKLFKNAATKNASHVVAAEFESKKVCFSVLKNSRPRRANISSQWATPSTIPFCFFGS
jgi:hypothetical protein